MKPLFSTAIKTVLAISFFTASLNATAQSYPKMNMQEMQQFYQQAQKAQACYEQIPQEKIDALQKKGISLQKKIEPLCKSGTKADKDKAQKIALDFAKEIHKDETMNSIKKCAAFFEGLQQGTLPLLDLEKDYSRYHICETQQ
jgi:Skp family chaperone for outer membrane proteins